MKPPFLAEIGAELEQLEQAGLRRHLRTVGGPLLPEIELDGRPVIQFCSNDYLGLAAHPALTDAARRALDETGSGAGAARLIVGNHHEHDALESDIARWLGTEAALLFGSGFLANAGLPSALTGPDDVIFSDRLNHASLIDGCRLARARVCVYPHADLDALAIGLAAHRSARRRLILSESVFSMDGDHIPAAALSAVAREHQAILVVDEAHAFGALGPNGRGLFPGPLADLHVGTLGKALGSYGAFVAGPRDAIDLLLQRARSFVFSTALPPSVAAAGRAAIALVTSAEGVHRRALLADRVAQLHRGLDAIGLPPRPDSHIAAIVVGAPQRAMQLTARLLDRGLYVQGIRPPTVPEGTARLRISLSAAHTEAHVGRLLQALADERASILR